MKNNPKIDGRTNKISNPLSGAQKLVIIITIDSTMPIKNRIDAIILSILALSDLLVKYLPGKNNKQNEPRAAINHNQKSSLKYPLPNPNINPRISKIKDVIKER